MKKYIYIPLFILLVALSSCSDYLEREPSFSLNEENGVTNFSKAEAAVGGVYETFIDSDQWSGQYYTDLASRSGFIKWRSAEYNMEYAEGNETTSSIRYRWSYFYKSLNSANFAIEGISNLSNAQVPSEEERNSLLGQARCLRAWININLLWNYGHWWSDDYDNPNGLLYRDQVVNLGNIEKARISVGESYDKIFEDLDYAIANLGSFKSSRYVSKEFAKVLKAKILLYRGGMNDNASDLQESLGLVNEVLNTSVSGFSMQDDLAKVYKDSWDSEENLFSRYLEEGNRTYKSYYYSNNITTRYADKLPRDEDQITAKLNFGSDWFKADPRWDIVTGDVHSPASWDTNRYYTWTKVVRLAQYDGVLEGDEKYNTYYFRYPELYIMKSELLARTGASTAEAIAPINLMRSKRTNPVLPSLTVNSQQELMDTIFKEYFLETFLENGSEYYASLRFKTAGEPWIVAIKNGKILDKNKLCYPIPEEEMEFNKLMTQNIDL
ncbi:RagB/SusD family nutrient uptake outer membrane protein [Polaribacter undariae]|uniref:RagB/SusD family nutrient uptake outer membrane protein n=1 Tax=Polaribacter sejongensis TaxID=985043 RepID=A0AAJ1QYS1_9FLAO|nr:RagB/SusD family nutrient uptake outer membrane protein [Polaribacter undariae]MDN3620086.1 RagB/SusD family nutrient uptake outer membrane protein [Polaribacter undariae]UWD32233.1 RagB/SusD family nutrient uptake outer membrane protein [Polaribacter undariae]